MPSLADPLILILAGVLTGGCMADGEEVQLAPDGAPEEGAIEWLVDGMSILGADVVEPVGDLEDWRRPPPDSLFVTLRSRPQMCPDGSWTRPYDPPAVTVVVELEVPETMQAPGVYALADLPRAEMEVGYGVGEDRRHQAVGIGGGSLEVVEVEGAMVVGVLSGIGNFAVPETDGAPEGLVVVTAGSFVADACVPADG